MSMVEWWWVLSLVRLGCLRRPGPLARGVGGLPTALVCNQARTLERLSAAKSKLHKPSTATGDPSTKRLLRQHVWRTLLHGQPSALCTATAGCAAQ